MNKRVIVSVVFVLTCFTNAVLSQETDKVEARVGSVDFIECVKCDDRVLYIPFVEFGYLPFGPHKSSGTVGIEVEVNDAGSVSNAKRIYGHPWFGAVLSKVALEARFQPRNNDKNAGDQKYVLKFLVTSPFDAVQNRELPIINGLGAPIVALVFPADEITICTEREVRVRVRSHFYWGRIISAKAVSGDLTLFEAAETAAFETTLKSAVIDPLPNGYFDGLLVYQKPKSKDCPPTIGHYPPGTTPTFEVIPEYSVEARRLNIKGTVRVRVLVGIDGVVIDATALSGDPLLAKSAVAAALKTLFSPYQIGGQAVQVNSEIVYDFK